MESSIDKVKQWKREHIAFEPTMSYVVLTRFQQYLDALMLDLNLSPYRKMPNGVAEIFRCYTADDYEGVVQEFDQMMQTRTTSLRPRADIDT